MGGKLIQFFTTRNKLQETQALFTYNLYIKKWKCRAIVVTESKHFGTYFESYNKKVKSVPDK